jgi:hypothetical protein
MCLNELMSVYRASCSQFKVCFLSHLEVSHEFIWNIELKFALIQKIFIFGLYLIIKRIGYFNVKYD